MSNLSLSDGISVDTPPQSDPATCYLNLIKRTLTDLIYIDNPMSNLVPWIPKKSTATWKRLVMGMLQQVLRRYQISLAEPAQSFGEHSTEDHRMLGRDWPARAHTMIGLKRLDNLETCVETVLREGIPGDLIETGVWRGGACIFMRAILKVHDEHGRRVWVADSFKGLPPPDAANYAPDAGDTHYTHDFLAVSREQVESNFSRYGLLDDQICFLEGWFKDTLPNAPIERLAVIRLDGDMYESTIQVLETLYDKLSPGGFVIIDDYMLKPCAQAVHDFRRIRNITDPIQDIDGVGAFWRRSA